MKRGAGLPLHASQASPTSSPVNNNCVWLARGPALDLAIILSAVVLFAVGAYQALTRVGSWWKQGARMVAIGLGAAALGFLIGHLFHASGG